MTWPDYPSTDSSYFGDGTTYGSELGRISPEGNTYGAIRFVREWRHLKWWDGAQWLDVEVSGQADSFSALPNTPRPFGEIWRVPEPDLRRSGMTWVGYFWDSEHSVWKPLKWRWNVDGISNLPIPGRQIGEAHVVLEAGVPTYWNGFQWCRLRHGALEDDEADRHLPEGFLQVIAPDVRVVFVNYRELGLEAVQGGAGQIWVGGEYIKAQRTSSVLSNLASIEWNNQTDSLVFAHVEPDTEYWVYLSNTLDLAFICPGLPLDPTHNAAPAWDFRGKLFLSRSADVNAYLSDTGSGKNARLVGKIQTDATAASTGGPFFIRELDISLVSRTTNFPETYREYSDFVIEFVDEQTLSLALLDGAWGQIYVGGGLWYLGADYDIALDAAWIDWNISYPEMVDRKATALSADSQYYIYLAGVVDPFNFNAVNPDTGSPWTTEDQGAETHYDATLDFRLRPFISRKAPEHGKMAESWPGYYVRHVGQVRTDGNGHFINARDLSAVRQPTLNPTYFDGMAEFGIVRVSNDEFRIVKKSGSSGIINVGGSAVQTYGYSDSCVHKINVQSIVQIYVEGNLEAPLISLDMVLSHTGQKLYLYLANDRSFWGSFQSKVFLSQVPPTGGYLSLNWPGNNARYLASIGVDANGQFTGSFITDAIAPDAVYLDDSIATVNASWSSAKIQAELMRLWYALSSGNLWTEEQSAGIAVALSMKDQTHLQLLPVNDQDLLVVFPDLSNTTIPAAGFQIALPAISEYSPDISPMTSNTAPSPQRVESTPDDSYYKAWKAFQGFVSQATLFGQNGSGTTLTTSNPAIVSIRLAQAQWFSAYRIWAISDYTYYPCNFELSVSNLFNPDIFNDNHWETVDSQTGISSPGATPPWYLLPDVDRSWLHWRLKVTQANSSNTMTRIGRIQFWDRTWGPIVPMSSDSVPSPQATRATSVAYNDMTDYGAWRALDGGITSASRWVSLVAPTVETPQVWSVKLAVAAAFKGVRFMAPAYAVSQVNLLGSNLSNPSLTSIGDWTVLGEFTNIVYVMYGGIRRSAPLMCANTTEFLHYALWFPWTSNNSQAELWQVQFIPAGKVLPDLTDNDCGPFHASATSVDLNDPGCQPFNAFQDNYYYTSDAYRVWGAGVKPTNDSPSSIALDLSSDFAIALQAYRIRATNWGTVDLRAYPKNVELSGSNEAFPNISNAGDWVILQPQVALVEPGSFGKSEWITVPRGPAYRHYRWTFRDSYSSGNALRIQHIEMLPMHGQEVYLKADGLHLSTDFPDGIYPALKTLGQDAIWVAATTG